jgi:hypothetical protein
MIEEHTLNKNLIVYCTKHTDEILTTYCCKTLTPLCAECIDDHVKHVAEDSISKPEFDTFKRVRTFCGLKISSLTKALEDELTKLGLSINQRPEEALKQSRLELEQARKQLHKLVDEYMD